MKAIQIDKDADGKVTAALLDIEPSNLPEGDVTVAVDYSTINYKDGLVLNGLGGLVRNGELVKHIGADTPSKHALSQIGW